MCEAPSRTISASPVLLSAAHGFLHFAGGVNENTFIRSFTYNLLFQREILIPDHYILQGSYLNNLRKRSRSGSSWFECALRNRYLIPCYRLETDNLSKILRYMQAAGRRGFLECAKEIAEQVDVISTEPVYWDSESNSLRFRKRFLRTINDASLPFVDVARRLSPESFLRFWHNSRDWWIQKIVEPAIDLNPDAQGEGVLKLSSMLSLAGERFLRKPGILTVDDFLDRLLRMGSESFPSDYPDSSNVPEDAYYFFSLASEVYNKNMARTLESDANSPRWSAHTAALDLAVRPLASENFIGEEVSDVWEETILIPTPDSLLACGGEVLHKIRETTEASAYFERLDAWRILPNRSRYEVLVDALIAYAERIRCETKSEAGVLFHTSLVSSTNNLELLMSYGADLVALGVLALPSPVLLKAGAVCLFVLRRVFPASRDRKVSLEFSADVPGGVRVIGDVTICQDFTDTDEKDELKPVEG